MTIFEINIFWINFAPSYYWLMYAIWFLAGYFIILRRDALISYIDMVWIPPLRASGTPFGKGRKTEMKDLMDNLFLYIFVWVVLGGRLGYVLFYDLGSYISAPLAILKVWEWWMSFHWWVIWVLIAMIWFAKKFKISFLKLADQIILVLPIWLWLGRIWNYLNQELLWYSWYEWIFAVYKNWVGYFPSPLLEAILEWLVLYIILNTIYYINNKNNNKTQNQKKYGFDWQIATLFLIFYAIFRILVEMFFRTPDSQIWYIFWYFTLWELLSLPMFIAWVIIYFILKNKKWS